MALYIRRAGFDWWPDAPLLEGGTDDVKITAYKSDVSGELVADEKQLARIRVSYPNDARRASRVIDASAAEAEELLGDIGRTEQRRGRKPAAAPGE